MTFEDLRKEYLEVETYIWAGFDGYFHPDYVNWLENKIIELSREKPEKIKVQVQRKINGTNQTIVREVKMTQEEWDELYKITSEVNERGW